MLLGIEIGLFLAGLAALITGTFRLTGRVVRRGAAARIAGLVLLFPLPLAFGVPFVIGLDAGLSGRPVDLQALQLPLALIDLGISAGGFLAATVIALAFGRRPDQDPGTARPVPAAEPLTVLPVEDDDPSARVQKEPRPVLPPRRPAARTDRRERERPSGHSGAVWWVVGSVLAGVLLLVLIAGTAAVWVLWPRPPAPAGGAGAAAHVGWENPVAEPPQPAWNPPAPPPMNVVPGPGPEQPEIPRFIVPPAVPEPGPPAAPARPAGPDPKLLRGDLKVYLSDMREDVVQGQFTKHGKARDGFFAGAITLDGRKSPHGLGMFLPNGGSTRVRYALGKKAQRFQALAAFNDFGGAGPLGPVTFRALGDGKLLWESEPVLYRREPQECSVEVRGVDELDLEVQVGGFVNGSPAVWFEPCVFTDAAAARKEPPLLPLRTDVRAKAGEVPAGVEANTPLAGKEERRADAVVTRIKLPVHDLPGCLCWAADGNSFYYLNAASGTLGQVALADLQEVRRLEIDRKCSWLSVSAEGLVVTVADRQEVWVIDPDTFRVKERLQVPSATRAVSSPALSVAFVPMPPEWMEAPWWQVLDLRTGERVLGPAPRYPPNQERPQLQSPTLTPDGKYLLTRGDHDGRLHRFRVDGPKLVYEESSPPVVEGRDSDLCLSPDGKLVCLPSGGGNRVFFAPNHPPLPPYGTYIYPVTNLQRPEFTIQQGPYPHIVAFDPAGRLIYANQSTSVLGVFRPSGVKIKDLDFGGQTGEAKQTLVHPRGRKVLLLGDELLYVEISLP